MFIREKRLRASPRPHFDCSVGKEAVELRDSKLGSCGATRSVSLRHGYEAGAGRGYEPGTLELETEIEGVKALPGIWAEPGTED